MINVLEATWNDNDCCSNIAIGAKVADTTLKYKGLSINCVKNITMKTHDKTKEPWLHRDWKMNIM